MDGDIRKEWWPPTVSAASQSAVPGHQLGATQGVWKGQASRLSSTAEPTPQGVHDKLHFSKGCPFHCVLRVTQF